MSKKTPRTNGRQSSVEAIVRNGFRNLILSLGGIFILQHTDDRLVETVAESIEEIYRDTMARLAQERRAGGRSQATPRDLRKPHPAIERLLRLVEREAVLFRRRTAWDPVCWGGERR